MFCGHDVARGPFTEPELQGRLRLKKIDLSPMITLEPTTMTNEDWE
jgi:hypothetical protein